MNWDRAKTTLIILFIIVNLLLAWGNYRKQLGIYTLKETQISDIKKVLEKNNIYVDCAIPKTYKPLQKLTVFPYQLDSSKREELSKQILGTPEEITVSLEASSTPGEKPKRIYRRKSEIVVFEGENIIYRNEDIKDCSEPVDLQEAKKMGDQWINQIGYDTKDMYMQVIEQAEGSYIIYYDQYEGVPIFDSYVKMRVAPSGVYDVTIHKVNIGELTGNLQSIDSADQVFFYLMSRMVQRQPIHIKDIVIGYALENPKGTHLVAEEAIPFYQVMLDSGDTYYINAYTNELREENSPIMEKLK